MKKKWIKRTLGKYFPDLSECSLFCTIAMLLMTVLIPAQSGAQNRQISINKQNVTFEEIVREVESQTDYTFMYSTEAAKSIGRVSVNVSNATINRLMDLILAGKAYTYQIEDKVVVLRAKNETVQKSAEKKPVKIEGKVFEAGRSPLAGAAVVIKGTQAGVVTDEEGRFELDVPFDKSVLVISFISKKTKEVNISGKTTVEVTLEDDEMAINQVVVTGIFNKSRESYTGSLTTITDKELKAAGNRNILLSIRNIDPSFNIAEDLEFGSDPNRLPDITIRGRTSMDVNVRNLQEESSIQSNANLPLFIMDGFEVSLQRVMDMDEEMVETITLLKDASATALYGSRGANGIVVITLKRPAEGKLRVSYRGGINLEVPDFTSYNLMNAREKLAYEKAANLFNSIYYPSNQNLQELYNQRLIEVERGVDTYWLKYPVRTTETFSSSTK